MIDPITFHITLLVMHLPGPLEIEQARLTLKECIPIIDKYYNDIMKEINIGSTENSENNTEEVNATNTIKELNLKVKGLSNFGSRVIFAKLSAPLPVLNNLKALVEEIHTQFFNKGLVQSITSTWQPHITIMKSSKSKLKQPISRMSYVKYINTEFGSTTIDSIEFLEMKRKDTTKYYPSYGKVYLDSSIVPRYEL